MKFYLLHFLFFTRALRCSSHLHCSLFRRMGMALLPLQRWSKAWALDVHVTVSSCCAQLEHVVRQAWIQLTELLGIAWFQIEFRHSLYMSLHSHWHSPAIAILWFSELEHTDLTSPDRFNTETDRNVSSGQRSAVSFSQVFAGYGRSPDVQQIKRKGSRRGPHGGLGMAGRPQATFGVDQLVMLPAWTTWFVEVWTYLNHVQPMCHAISFLSLSVYRW